MDNRNIIYQKLTEEKIDTFIQMRINQLREEGATEDVDLAPALSLGDPTKAREQLGWNPQKTSFEELVRIMVQHDMKKVKKLYLREHMDD